MYSYFENIELSFSKTFFWTLFLIQFHIKESTVLNISKEKYKTNNYIGPNVDNVPVSQILTSIHETHKEFTNWLSIFAKELPGFDKFNQEDFMKIVSSSFQLAIGLHVKDLYFNNDLYVITSNGYQLSRNQMNIGFGSLVTSF